MALHPTWFELLGQPLSVHQDREGISTAVGLMNLSDLHRVVHKVILDGDRHGVCVQRVTVVPHCEETQHLTKKKKV